MPKNQTSDFDKYTDELRKADLDFVKANNGKIEECFIDIIRGHATSLKSLLLPLPAHLREEALASLTSDVLEHTKEISNG